MTRITHEQLLAELRAPRCARTAGTTLTCSRPEYHDGDCLDIRAGVWWSHAPDGLDPDQ